MNENIMNQLTQILCAYIEKNNMNKEELIDFIPVLHDALLKINNKEEIQDKISTTITDDYLICLEDGQKVKMLGKYIKSKFGMTVQAYKQKWNLPADYPMTAPSYSAKRSSIAKSMGFGKISTGANK